MTEEQCPAKGHQAKWSRRRMITLVAAAGGVAALPGGATPNHRAPPIYEWRGQALGAEARLLLAHGTAEKARRAAAFCLAEIARLEQAFSLFRSDSEICRLNATGLLAQPSQDFRALLGQALRFGALTQGAFDVTVQPLWRLYAAHFGGAQPDLAGPAPRLLASVRALVDYRAVDAGRDRIHLPRPGMAMTFNGIAQGYITDRVADLLRDAGFDHVLVQLGETRALGDRQVGRPWRIDTPGGVLALSNRAIATSSGPASRFDPAGRHHHLFDPRNGRSAEGYQSVTVIAGRATDADTLSTALAVAPPDRADAILAVTESVEALLVLSDGSRRRLVSPGFA